jgi:hypothetical protein
MHKITIADHLWMEPTLLGVTLNYSEGPRGLHFRVGISHYSVKDCDRALQNTACLWAVRDGSFSIFGDQGELTLTFSAGKQPLQRRLVLSGQQLEDFKQAIGLFTEAAIPRMN